MPKQTLIFENAVQLSLKNGQMNISYKDNPEQEHFRAIEDIATILVDNHSVNMTVPLLGELAENNVAVVFCNQKHMPASMLMNLDANCKQEKFFRLQLDASEPTKKTDVEKCRGNENSKPVATTGIPWQKFKQTKPLCKQRPQR